MHRWNISLVHSDMPQSPRRGLTAALLRPPGGGGGVFIQECTSKSGCCGGFFLTKISSTMKTVFQIFTGGSLKLPSQSAFSCSLLANEPQMSKKQKLSFIFSMLFLPFSSPTPPQRWQEAGEKGETVYKGTNAAQWISDEQTLLMIHTELSWA